MPNGSPGRILESNQFPPSFSTLYTDGSPCFGLGLRFHAGLGACTAPDRHDAKFLVPESDGKHRHRGDAGDKFPREDTASCINRGEHWTATIMPMDPKRAKVNCSEAV